MGESPKLHNHDRLSKLPESLMITILSFLEMNDAVRTSVLSKRWRDRWTALPSLKFWRPQVGDLDMYRSFVYGALLQWKGAKILKFELPFSSVNPPSRDLDSWLLFAIGKQVEELRLCLGSVNSDYSPLQRLYTCSSIRKLTLSFVKLSIPENVQLSQLTSLTVEGEILLSGRDMTRLLTGAPLLEELALVCKEITDYVNIRSESLKKLHIGIGKCRSISLRPVLRILAPNLSTLEIKAGVPYYGSCFQLDVPSLTTAILYFYQASNQSTSLLRTFYQVFRSISHAQSVTLSNLFIKFLLYLKKKGKSVEFSNAKHVKVLYNVIEAVDEMLLGVVETFPNLLTLAIDVYYNCTKDGDSFSASEKKIHLPLPNLKKCEIRFSKTNSSILRAIKAVLENGEMLEKMVLLVRNEEALGWGALEKVVSIRRSSPKATVIISKETTTS